MFEVEFENKRNQNGSAQWDLLLENLEKKVEWYFFKDASIFGRATLINTIFESKMLYLAHTYDPPPKTLKKYNVLVRNFILKGTLHKMQ